MEKIWIRLGGFVFADKETMAKIKDGDDDALLQAIKDNGFQLDGESYIPDTCNPDGCGDIEFSLYYKLDVEE